MNIQSWILLLAVLGFCSYVIYTRYISKTKGSCADCTLMKNGNTSCNKCKH